MLRWLKGIIHEEITADDFLVGTAFLSATPGMAQSIELPAADFSDFVRRYGTPTRIFKDVRHDN